MKDPEAPPADTVVHGMHRKTQLQKLGSPYHPFLASGQLGDGLVGVPTECHGVVKWTRLPI